MPQKTGCAFCAGLSDQNAHGHGTGTALHSLCAKCSAPDTRREFSASLRNQHAHGHLRCRQRASQTRAADFAPARTMKYTWTSQKNGLAIAKKNLQERGRDARVTTLMKHRPQQLTSTNETTPQCGHTIWGSKTTALLMLRECCCICCGAPPRRRGTAACTKTQAMLRGSWQMGLQLEVAKRL